VIVWDLCSGLGGWSEAFVQLAGAEDITVFRFDNSPLVHDRPRTLNEDVTQWIDWVDSYPAPDLILASPPCLEFSQGFNAPRPKAKRAGIEFHPDLTIAKSVRDIIMHVEPRWWAVENVIGSIEDLSPLYGRPRQIIGSFVLWGNFPLLPNVTIDRDSKAQNDTWSTDPLRSRKRAVVPIEISRAMLDAWYEQTDLLRWL
jgi:site-specific DNA-cytosine methylase